MVGWFWGQIVDGRLRVHEVSRFSTSFSDDGPYLSRSIDRIDDEIRRGINAEATATRISSVAVDSWAVDYILLDARQQRVGGAISYRDKRTEGMIERVTAKIPRCEIYRCTGIQFQPFITLYQLAAMAVQEPNWAERAEHLLMIPDYLHFRFAGVLSNEYTNATTTQLLDLNGEWDQEILKAAGLPRLWMKPPVEAGTILGEMQIGGVAAHVVAPATHDTASAVVGTPLESPDEIFLSSGTWSLMGIESAMPFATEQARHWNFSNEGGFGRHYRVLKNIMGLWLLQRVCKESQIVIDETLLEAAAQVPRWRSIVNPDDPRFLNPPSMKNAIQDFCSETGQPIPESAAEYTRCAIESLALCYRMVKQQLEDLSGKRLKKIRIVGGGSRNRLLNQLCANCCESPVSSGPIEASALGNLCVQMIAIGELASLEEARAMIRSSFPPEEYLPQEETPAEVWTRFKQYTAVIPKEVVR